MNNHSLNLLDNAIDSLSEALRKYREGEDGELKSYKFAVLHMSHFLELIFKHHIAQQHELLIYKNPFAQSLDKSKTISFWDAVNFINNETGEIDASSEFRRDLEWLKKLRNDIEHYHFDMNVQEVRDALGRIFRSLIEFLDIFSDLSLKDYVPKDLSEVFVVLSDEYSQKVREAEIAADQAEEEAFRGVRPKEMMLVNWERIICPECDNNTFITDHESPTGYRCTFCGADESDEMLVDCGMCGAPTELSELVTWEAEGGEAEQRCYYCSGRHHADRDD